MFCADVGGFLVQVYGRGTAFVGHKRGLCLGGKFV